MHKNDKNSLLSKESLKSINYSVRRKCMSLHRKIGVEISEIKSVESTDRMDSVDLFWVKKFPDILLSIKVAKFNRMGE